MDAMLIVAFLALPFLGYVFVARGRRVIRTRQDNGSFWGDILKGPDGKMSPTAAAIVGYWLILMGIALFTISSLFLFGLALQSLGFLNVKA